MGAHRAVRSPSLPGKHARQGQGRRRAQRREVGGDAPPLPVRACTRERPRRRGGGLASPRWAGLSRGGAHGWARTWGHQPELGSRAAQVSLRSSSRQVSVLQERSVPLRRRRRGPPDSRNRPAHPALCGQHRFRLLGLASLSPPPPQPVPPPRCRSPGPHPQCLTLIHELRNAR